MKFQVFPENHDFSKEDVRFKLYKPNWHLYRLSDMIRDPYTHSLQDSIKQNFKGSLAEKWFDELNRKRWKNTYNKEAWKHFVNYMKPLIEEKVDDFVNDTEINVREACLFHIRLGDIFDNRKDRNKNQHRYHLFKYHTPIQRFEEMLRVAKRLGYKKIYLVCGIHWIWGNWENNVHYLKDLRNIVNKHGLQHQVISADPDTDFSILCMCKHFGVSGGGFSSTIRIFRDINIGPEQDQEMFNIAFNKEAHKDYYRGWRYVCS
jgi:hypothetical protein